jgi:hypothetical protein
MTSLPAILAEVSAQGWLVNNLFQLDDGSWRADLRDATRFTRFGNGPTPSAALDAALDAMTFDRPPSAIATWAPSAIHLAIANRPALADLLGLSAIHHQPRPAPAASPTTRNLRRF